jgi:hypothetical protein
MDAARPRIHCPQVIHLPPGTAYRSRSPKGRKDVAQLGLQHWQEETKGIKNVLDSCTAHPHLVYTRHEAKWKTHSSLMMLYDPVITYTCKIACPSLAVAGAYCAPNDIPSGIQVPFLLRCHVHSSLTPSVSLVLQRHVCKSSAPRGVFTIRRQGQ